MCLIFLHAFNISYTRNTDPSIPESGKSSSADDDEGLHSVTIASIVVGSALIIAFGILLFIFLHKDVNKRGKVKHGDDEKEVGYIQEDKDGQTEIPNITKEEIEEENSEESKTIATLPNTVNGNIAATDNDDKSKTNEKESENGTTAELKNERAVPQILVSEKDTESKSEVDERKPIEKVEEVYGSETTKATTNGIAEKSTALKKLNKKLSQSNLSKGGK